jgi:hypothetical protein
MKIPIHLFQNGSQAEQHERQMTVTIFSSDDEHFPHAIFPQALHLL